MYQLHNVSDKAHDQDCAERSQYMWFQVARWSSVRGFEARAFEYSCSAYATREVDKGTTLSGSWDY